MPAQTRSRKSQKTIKKPFFKVLKYYHRLMVELDQVKSKRSKRMFYRSTGICSKLKDTWFPCRGIQAKKTARYPLGWIKKPIGESVNFFLHKNLCKHDSFLCIRDFAGERFGTLENMVISAKIGGGFWQENTDVLEFLKTHKLWQNKDLNKDIVRIQSAIMNEGNLKNLDLEEALKELY